MTDLRQACDRCHDKKLRCPKVSGRPASCTRCIKASVPCVFSPPTKPLGVSAARRDLWTSHIDGQAYAQQPMMEEEAMWCARPEWTDLMEFDPPQTGVAYDAFSHVPGSLVEENSSSTSRPSVAALPPKSSLMTETSSTDLSDITGQLAAIISGLESNNQPLASLRGHHAAKDRLQDWADELRGAVDLSNFLESLLTYAQNIATLYITISDLVRPSSPGSSSSHRHEDCPLPDCIHQHTKDRPAVTSVSPIQEHCALLNLLLSCHLKLLETVDTVITHCHTCSRFLAALPASTRESRFDIPEIRIGSFIAPRGAAASLFTTMLYQLLDDLRDKNRGLAGTPTPDPEGHSVPAPREVQVLKLQAEIIDDRTEAALEAIRDVKAKMLDMGIVK